MSDFASKYIHPIHRRNGHNVDKNKFSNGKLHTINKHKRSKRINNNHKFHARKFHAKKNYKAKRHNHGRFWTVPKFTQAEKAKNQKLFKSIKGSQYVLGYHIGYKKGTKKTKKNKIKTIYRPYVNTLRPFAFKIDKNTTRLVNNHVGTEASVQTRFGKRYIVILKVITTNQPKEVRKIKQMQPVLDISSQKLLNRSGFFNYFYRKLVLPEVIKLNS